jgi:hypothetical protein
VLPTWFFTAVSLTVVLGFVGLTIMRRRAGLRADAADWDWVGEFSVEKYRPMHRLLCEEDHAFLRTQPGYQSSLSRTLRRNRLRVFRSYLRSLRRDFTRLYWAAKASVLYSPTDESQALQAIVRQRAIFYLALCRLEMRLALYSLGIGTVDLQPVLGALEAMRDATRVLQPAAA